MNQVVLAAATAGTPVWLTAAIGAGGLLMGVLATVAGNTYVARTKIKEAELVYRQRLADSYLDTARAYTHEIYIPLNIALSRLADEYLVLRDSLDPEAATAPEASADAFRDAITAFSATVNGLTSRGADAFLTTELETRLREFTHFLGACLSATEETSKLVVQALSGFWSSRKTGLFETQTSSTVLPAVFQTASSVAGMIPATFGLQFRFTTEVELLSAPITSPAFAQRFNRDILLLKAAIKLVTLGAKDPG
jgi:hypothetical protein